MHGHRKPKSGFGCAGLGAGVAGASLLIGGLLGFLFGIPRSQEVQEPGSGNDPSADASASKNARVFAVSPNTNLEQISDWLTKILVGVGLVQATAIADALEELGKRVAIGYGNSEGALAFAISIILFFLISGFLFSYLWTRLYLPGEFRQAELLNSLISRMQKVGSKVARLSKQAERDAEAISLIQRRMNHGLPLVSDSELEGKIKEASPSARGVIFTQTQQMRKENWRDHKEVMADLIPIFRALTASDPTAHRYVGQLGYCLKDQSVPDWKGAEEALTIAIKKRGDEDSGRTFYEFNRAICKIKLDQKFAAGQVSEPENRSSILEDLRTAWRGVGRLPIKEDSTVEGWMRINQVAQTQLGTG